MASADSAQAVLPSLLHHNPVQLGVLSLAVEQSQKWLRSSCIMCKENETEVTEFRLLGFKGLNNLRFLLFFVLLLVYNVIVGGNLLIICLVSTNDALKIPMFFFVKHLAIADVLLTTCIIPLTLDIILKTEGVISVRGCMTQLSLFGIFVCVQCFIIAIMSYDRYVAISKPLQYTLIMDSKICFHLIFWSWFLVVSLVSSEMIYGRQFPFCGQNVVDHFFCDFGPVLALQTTDTAVARLEDLLISLVTIFFPFTFILGTYLYIFITVIKMSSTAGKIKAFSTCSSHLVTVGIHYGTLITVYVSPTNEDSPDLNKFRSLLYIVVTPLMNPILYSFRNHEIKLSLQKLFKGIKGTH
ncbi:olfactory receptor 10A7-like [Hyperolius riggenbachi]|uniref:olfactory receptor 10A7-like n=1 Tax=Hyperolius riggenbachi TaxID=752182 RepID=UPI0035A31ADA